MDCDQAHGRRTMQKVRQLWQWIAPPSKGIATDVILLAGLAVGMIGLDGLHKGIADQLPATATGYKELLSDLQANAAKTKAKAGDVLYPLATKPLFVDRPNDANGPPDGRLIAATPVKVIKVDGDWLQVEVGGWQQQGAERMLYAKQGQRINAAALGPPAVEKVQQGQSITDQNTNQVWSAATLTAWTSKDNLVPDVNKLWAYCQEMYSAACGACHPAHATTQFLANQWIGSFNGMRPRTSLDDEEARVLQKYLQLHAKDSAENSSDGKAKH
jgi:trimethylamine-N-oxide reductase cytochrome c-type subunit TorC